MLIRVTVFVCLLAFTSANISLDARNTTYNLTIVDGDQSNNDTKAHRDLMIVRFKIRPSTSDHTKSDLDECKPKELQVNGKPVETVTCRPYKYTIFTQEWLPTLLRMNPQTKCVDCIGEGEEKYWYKYLIPSSLRPIHSNKPRHPTNVLPVDVEKYIAESNPYFEAYYGTGKKKNMYQQEWQTHGIYTGLDPRTYIREMFRLQNEHYPQERLFHSVTGIITREQLTQAYPKQCLVCHTIKGKQYLRAIEHCYAVNPITNMATNLVKLKRCKPCLTKSKCTNWLIYIPRAPVKD